MNLQSPVSCIKGVGPASEVLLERMGIRCAQDLLWHLPKAYEDRTRLMPLSWRSEGAVYCQVTIHKIVHKRGKPAWLCLHAQAQTVSVHIYFFHGLPLWSQRLKQGMTLRLYGRVTASTQGLKMVHPHVQIIDEAHPPPLASTYDPIYPTVEGLRSKSIQTWIKHVLDDRGGQQEKPAWMLWAEKASGCDLWQSLQVLHRPSVDVSLSALENRTHVAFKPLVFIEYWSRRLHFNAHRVFEEAPPYDPHKTQTWHAWLRDLPWALTSAQTRVLKEITEDFARAHPMARLLHGDVGSGKTLVAIGACVRAIDQGWQCAVMAPTELLATQLFTHFQKRLAPLGINVAFLSGSTKAKERKKIFQDLASGAIACLCGTHALFQEPVTFARLGLMVIDEQHRFGVMQRAKLQKKGRAVHTLMMSATPIPRTLAMTLYADRDVSVLDIKPQGRLPIITSVHPLAQWQHVCARLLPMMQSGQQVYWVCALIEDHEDIEAQSVTVRYAQLQAHMPHIRIGCVHGALSAQEKNLQMEAFARGETQILLATTVIEVGVDVPQATVMVIENAERFGLAQLHQLRGRVGRSDRQSYCLLCYQEPLSAQAQQRLACLRSHQDGFELAELDLKMRGAGEFLGVQQSGGTSYRILDDYAHHAWIQEAARHKPPQEIHDDIIALFYPLAKMVETV